MEFNTAYTPMDRGYSGNQNQEPDKSNQIEKPVVALSEIGQTVTEGRQFGSFIQSVQGAIRQGSGRIELQTQQGGGAEPLGAESYGHDAREAIREIAKANEVELTSVHTPTSIPNMSGFNPQQGSFNDEYRKTEVEEVKRSIRFAAEAAQGGAVVVHTGEYQRPIFDAPWNKDEKFVSYDEEPERSVKPLVDTRTGRVISEVRMNQIVPRAVWLRSESEYVDDKGLQVREGDYVDYEGHRLDRVDRVPKYDADRNTFEVKNVGWDYFVDEAKEMNDLFVQKNGRAPNGEEMVTPEEAFLFATTETQEKISRGWASNYGLRLRDEFEALEELKEARDYYAKIEENLPDDEKWRLLEKRFPQTSHRVSKFITSQDKMPTQLLDEAIRDTREQIESNKDMVTGQLQQAEEQKILREHTKSMGKYALKKTMQSYAEAGIHAMRETHTNPFVKKDVFVAPENIFPEMGYGSHPDELIDLVKNARQEMVKHLTDQYIEDPTGKMDNNGKLVMVPNPHYSGMSKDQASQEAKQHIKATLDTQHLGMWYEKLKPLPGETEDKRKTRFNNWYMDQIKKLEKEDIIGNIHLVDCMSGQHQHLPAGQGDLPLLDAIGYLKKKGYKGFINSEGYGEDRLGAGRIMVETWRHFGSPIGGTGYAAPGGPQRWPDVQHSYFGRNEPPMYIVGAYSPSNDWTLWSEVNLE